MPTLTLITDLSPNFVANFSALAAQKGTCVRLPRRQRKSELSHQLIWEKAQIFAREDRATRRTPRKFYLSLSEMAEQGRDIRFWGQESAPMPHSWLFRLLRSFPELQRYTIQAAVCLGCPDVVLEQCCRLKACKRWPLIP